MRAPPRTSHPRTGGRGPPLESSRRSWCSPPRRGRRRRAPLPDRRLETAAPRRLAPPRATPSNASAKTPAAPRGDQPAAPVPFVRCRTDAGARPGRSRLAPSVVAPSVLRRGSRLTLIPTGLMVQLNDQGSPQLQHTSTVLAAPTWHCGHHRRYHTQPLTAPFLLTTASLCVRRRYAGGVTSNVHRRVHCPGWGGLRGARRDPRGRGASGPDPDVATTEDRDAVHDEADAARIVASPGPGRDPGRRNPRCAAASSIASPTSPGCDL